MPTFFYKAKKGPRELLTGEVEAINVKDAAVKIDNLGLFPITIEEEKPRLRKSSRVSSRELVEFTHQLSSLMLSGSNLLSSLNTLGASIEYSSLNPVITQIITQVKDGHDFSKALQTHPKVFSQLYVSLARAGEASGTLGENLKRLAEFMEEEQDFRANLVSVLTYPMLIVAVGILTVVVLLNFVIPKVVKVFSEIEQALPAPTLFLVNMSSFVTHYWLIILFLVIAAVVAVRQYLESKAGKFNWHRIMLKLPLVGDIITRIEICRMAKTLGLLLKNGLPIDRAVNVLSFTITNAFLRSKIEAVGIQIKEGTALSDAMRNTGVFSAGFINVIKLAEDSSNLDRALFTTAESYQKEISRRLKRVLNILEPLLILIVGLVVGFVVISMLLPIFSMDFNF